MKLSKFTWNLVLLILSMNVAAQTAAIKPGAFYLKINPQSSNQRSKTFDFSSIPGIINHSAVRKINLNQKTKPSILDGLYKVEVDKDIDIPALCKSLSEESTILYAEPVYEEQLLYTPNDPAMSDGNQDYLSVIKAPEAWEISQGSDQIVIGISDTGLDFENPDIQPKLYINENDPVNGFDDDGNGYVDDHLGFDFADRDTVASPDDMKHGTMVGGIAGAATDNNYGIAGVGFNTLLSSLKVYNTNKQLVNGYESVLYAADIGYDIINLSWGSINSYSQAYQDIITYAVKEKNLIVIAAAGNTHGDLKFYPASYEHVLSVAATDLQDQKAPFSTYNYSVDIVAPGQNIYSLGLNNTFTTDNGTSYSAPMVAGAAAIVKSVFSHLSAGQIMEQLRVTSDPVYAVGSNANFQDQLGFGRLNIHEAITNENAISVRIENIHYHNGYDEAIYAGDTISISFDVVNYLASTAVEFTFSSPSEYVTLLTDTISVEKLSSEETRSLSFPLLVVADETPPETALPIRVKMLGPDYEDYQYIELTTNPDLLHFNNNNIELSISGRGNLGFDSDNFFDGVGFRWNTTIMAARMGMLIAQDEQNVSDNLPEGPVANTREKDFVALEHIKYERNEQFDLKVSSVFSDTEIDNSLGIKVSQSVLSNWDADYIIQEYRLVNVSDESRDLNVGYYVDWSIPLRGYENVTYYDTESNAIVAADVDYTRFAGMVCYTDQYPVRQMIDLTDALGNLQDLGDLSDATKYQLSNTAMFENAGFEGNGSDISTMIAHDSITLDPSHSKKVAYLLGFGNTIEELRKNLYLADSAYGHYISNPARLGYYYGCSGSLTDIQPDTSVFRFYEDPLGKNLISESNILVTGPISSDTAFFAARIENNQEGEIQKMVIQLVDKVADFEMSTDTLYLDQQVNKVTFSDLSYEPVAWNWNFGNGQQATVQHPTMIYNQAGTYQITLNVTSRTGCTESFSRSLVVVNRPQKPTPQNHQVCSGDSLTLTAEIDQIAVYALQTDQEAQQQATEIKIGPIESDTIVYLTNVVGDFESLKTPIEILVSDVSAAFYWEPDTTAQTTGVLFHPTDLNLKSHIWYVDENLVNTTDILSLIVEKSQYEISHVVENEIGCIDSVSQIASFGKSDIPEITFEQPCFDGNLVLKPENGQYFGFYEDEALESLIHKGTNLWLENIQSSLVIYVVGLDNILPSSPVVASIDPTNTNFKIEVNPDTLYLDEQSTIQLDASGDSLISWRWFMDDLLVETAARPVLALNQSGQYRFVLEAENTKGCFGHDTLTFGVYDSRPEPIILITDPEDFKLFPNPALDQVTIHSPTPCIVNVLDLSGQKLISRRIENQETIGLSELAPAVYIVTFDFGIGKSIKRILVKN